VILAGILSFLLSAGNGTPQRQDLIAPCLVALQREPKALGPFQCLMAAAGQGQAVAVRGILARLLQKNPDDPRARFYLALLRDFAGEPVPETDFSLAAEGFRREGDPFGRVYALTSLVGSRCFGRLQCDAAAEDFLVEAERVAEGSASNQLRRLVQLFWLRVSLLKDDVARAERATSRLEALPGDDPSWLKGQLFEARGRLAYQLKNFDQEYSIFSEMLKVTTPGTAQHATALGGLAEGAAHLALRGREGRGTAEELLRRALDEQRHLDLRFTIGGNGSLRTAENLALLLGPTEESTRLLQQNLAVYTHETGWGGLQRAFSAEWILARNIIDSQPERASEALALADGTIERASGKHLLWEHAHGLLVRAYVLLKSGRRKEARTAADVSLGEMEELRRQQEDIEVRIRYEDTLAFAYELVAGLALDQRFGEIGTADVEYAFSTTERMRARALLEDILARNRAKALWRDAEAGLRQRIVASHELLMDSQSSLATRLAAVTELRTHERELTNLRSTEVSEPRHEGEFTSLAAVQAALSPGEALVSFQVWSPDARTDAPFVDGRSWAIIVMRSAIRVVQIPNADQLETRVNFFRQVLERRDGSERPGSLLLYDALMKPVVNSLLPGIENLVLIPDGPLHQLPFDALPMSASGPYLAERFGVTLAPSAAIWLSLRTRPLAHAGLALVLAKPDVKSDASSQTSWSGEPLDDLSEAYEEGLRAVRAFPPGSLLISGAAASRSSLLSMKLDPFTLLHFATHSLINPLRPERSAIVLASGNASDDGLLRVEDISKLALEDKTIILASCSTSAGVVRRSEGLMSLSRPFLAAGAQAVVGTLQRVRDSESSQFFDEFYLTLERGKSLRESLGVAKRARIRAGAPPAAWSNFVLLGNGDAAPRAPDAHKAGAVAELLCGAVAMAAVGFRLRRQWTRGRSGRARHR